MRVAMLRIRHNLRRRRHEAWASSRSGGTVGALRFADMLVRSFRAHGITQRAAALTLATLLALVPAMAIGFSAARALSLDLRIEPALLRVLGVPTPVPQGDAVGALLAGLVAELMDVVRAVDHRSLGILGVAIVLGTVIQSLSLIEATLNQTWGVRRTRHWGRKLTDYLAVIVIAPVVISGATTLAARATVHRMVALFPAAAPWATPILSALPAFGPPLLVWAGLTVLYILLPNARVRFLPASCGAAIATVGWWTAQTAYFTFQLQAAQLGAIYGTFAALPLFIVFLVIAWSLVLIGGEIAHGIQFLMATPRPSAPPPHLVDPDQSRA